MLHAGLPVINTQQSNEYINLIKKYNIGFNCDGRNAKNVAFYLEKLINDEELRRKMGMNNRNIAEKKFDRKKTYKELIKIVGEE